MAELVDAESMLIWPVVLFDREGTLADAVNLTSARAAGMSSIEGTWGAGLRSDLRNQHPAPVVDDVGELTVVLWDSPFTRNSPD
ncbi:MAG: hypothetical protein WBG36_08460 [Ornithinimicrobium sp.]